MVHIKRSEDVVLLAVAVVVPPDPMELVVQERLLPIPDQAHPAARAVRVMPDPEAAVGQDPLQRQALRYLDQQEPNGVYHLHMVPVVAAVGLASFILLLTRQAVLADHMVVAAVVDGGGPMVRSPEAPDRAASSG